MEDFLNEKTYELYVTNRINHDPKVLHLQVLNDNIVIDMEARQLFHGTIKEYMEYCNYEVESMEEKYLSYSKKLDVIESSLVSM